MTRRSLVVAAAVALLKGLVLLWLIPAFQTPDEYGHYDYVLYLAYADPVGVVRAEGLRDLVVDPRAFTTREVRCLAEVTGSARHMDDAIRVRVTASFSEQVARATRCRGLDSAATLAPAGRVNGLFNYPPLYHFAAASLHRVLRAAGANPLVILHAIRGCSTLLLIVALVVAARLMRVLGADEAVTRTVLLFLALHPELSMLSVAVQPDMLGLVLVSGSLLGLARLAIDPSLRRGAWLGAVIGALLLTKLHLALPLILAGLAALGVATLVQPASAKTWGRPAVVAVAAAAVVGGWWYLRSLIVFGNAAGLMETGSSLVVLPANPGENLRAFLQDRLEPLIRSYWGMWGWLDYGIGRSAVPWLTALTLVPAAVGGAALVAWRRQVGTPRFAPPPRVMAALAIIIGAMVLFAAEMLYITARLGAVNDQGRHWLAYAFVHALYFGSAVVALGDASFARVWRLVAGSRTAWAAVAAASGAIAACGAVLWVVAARPTGYVVVEMRSSVDSRLDVWVNGGIRHDPVEQESAQVRKRDGMATMRLPVRSAVVYGLRLDPIAAPGTVILRSVRLTDTTGRLVTGIPLDRFVAAQQVARAAVENGELHVETIPGGSDPILEVALPTAATFDPGPALRVLKRARPRVIEAYRAWPAARWIVPLSPAFSMLAALIGGFLVTGCRQPVPSATAAGRWRWAWRWGLATVLVFLNVWLAAQTWVYYRG